MWGAGDGGLAGHYYISSSVHVAFPESAVKVLAEMSAAVPTRPNQTPATHAALPDTTPFLGAPAQPYVRVVSAICKGGVSHMHRPRRACSAHAPCVAQVPKRCAEAVMIVTMVGGKASEVLARTRT